MIRKFACMMSAALSAFCVWSGSVVGLTTGGDAVWFEQSSVKPTGCATAWQSGKIDNGQETWLEYVASGAETLTFSAKVGSDNGYLEYDIQDGYSYKWGSVYQSDSWKTFTVSLRPGATIHWRYYLWNETASSSDRAWIGNLSTQPFPASRTMTFDGNGGYVCDGNSGRRSKTLSKSISIENGCHYDFPEAENDDGRCWFEGWQTQPAGGMQVQDGDFVDLSVTKLYARWAVDPEEVLGSDTGISWDYPTEDCYAQLSETHSGRGALCLGSGANWPNLSATVQGVGTFSFWWKTVGDSYAWVNVRDYYSEYNWNSVSIAYLSGSYRSVYTSSEDRDYAVSMTTDGGWTKITVEFYGSGEHVVDWDCYESGQEHGNVLIDDARWQGFQGEITVTKDFLDGRSKQTLKYQPGDTFGSLGTPTRSSWNFGGWYLDREFTRKVTEDAYVPFSGATVYAKWIKPLSSIETTG